MTAPTAAAEELDVPAVVEVGPEVDGEMALTFPVLVIEAVETSDGRYLNAGSLTHRALPLSLLACPESAHGGNDPDAAVVVGRIDTLTRTPGPEVVSKRTGEPFPEGSFVWSATGAMYSDVTVGKHNIGDLVRRRFLRGVSVDLAGMDVEMIGEGDALADAEHPRRRMVAHSAEIAAATLVPVPAFGDAYVELAGEEPGPVAADDPPEGLTASAVPAWRSAEVGDTVPAVTASLVAAGDDEVHTGGMIALVPANPDELTVEGGEPADELHLTLAYLGDDVTGWGEDQRTAVLDHVRGWAQDTQPIDADVMGWALFNPTGANDREPCAVHLVSGDGLPDAKGAMSDHDVSEHPVFLPHITAGYGVDLAALSFIGPVRFDKARVALGMDVVDFELGEKMGGPSHDPEPSDWQRDPGDAVVAAAPSTEQRDKAAEDGDTYPGTDKFPIDTRDRAASAVKLHASSDLPAEKVKAWLIRRLKAKGWDDLIPDSWKADASHTAQATAMAADPDEAAPNEAGTDEAEDAAEEMGMPDAPQDCEFGDHPAVKSLLFDDNTKYVAVCADDEQQGRDLIEQNGATVSREVDIQPSDTADDTEEVPA